MQVNPVIVGAGISGSGNTGELAYFSNNTTITGTPGIIVTNVAGASTIGFGTAPGTAAAINVDHTRYGGVALSVYSGATEIGEVGGAGTTTIYIGGVAGKTLQLRANGLGKWTVINEAAGTASLSSSENTARIVGGSSNGLAIRNSANTRDNLRVVDAGTTLTLNDGTNTVGLTTITPSTTISTGVGVIHMSTINGATNAAWLPVLINGTTYYVPCWTTNAP